MLYDFVSEKIWMVTKTNHQMKVDKEPLTYEVTVEISTDF
jgi:hypothetical protein